MIAVLGLAAATSFAVALALGAALAPADPLTVRARALAARLQVPEARAMAAPTRAQRALAWLSARLERADLLRGDEARAALLLLAQAGWRSSEALVVLLVARLVVPLAIGIASWLVLRAFGTAPTIALATTALIILIASRLPTLFVRNAATRRRQRLQAALPDALDLFVTCAEAGLSLDAAMHRVAREMAPGAPVIADELALTAVELGFLPRRSDALANWATRVPLASVRGLVNILAQTERYGTPLAQSLRILAAEFRAARMLEAEAKAARLPAVLTIPMIVFVLPPLFIVLIGPAIIEVMGR
jgi:tight adherence protein C